MSLPRCYAFLLACAAALAAAAAPLPDGVPVRGWTILSRSEADDMATIAAAPGYGINHIQLSHDLVMELKAMRDPAKAGLVNRLVDAAHGAGIHEVVVWDHALYALDYYPERFRTGPGGTLNLDDPDFWSWFKEDYRTMLDRLPRIDGLVLTFVDTGARSERQFSRRLTTNSQKLAAVVNAVADVVIGERHLSLYARTLASSNADYDTILGAVDLFQRPQVRLMMKETVEDFFLTSPKEGHAGAVPRPTLMEFDAAGEMNGQGIIANTWPDYFMQRWRDFQARPHVIGYTARTDRYGATRLVGRPGEIDLLALKLSTDDPQATSEKAYDRFISTHYGAAAVPEVKAAFRNAWDIVTSELYTLGNITATHSHLEPEPFSASYINYASGKWYAIPILTVGHGVDREFHSWRDVVQHIAPACAKDPSNIPWNEVPWVLERGWVKPGEAMDEEYLGYITTEKDYGVRLAEDSVAHIERARPVLTDADYRQLRAYFDCTLLTARLYSATARAYYGFRVWSRGGAYQTPAVAAAVRDGLQGITRWAAAVRAYPNPPPVGQWNWARDADVAEDYARWISAEGWPRDSDAEERVLQKALPDDLLYDGFNVHSANPDAGMTFPGAAAR
jgi:hypothetical protein